MEPLEYNRLGRFETWYWWYLAQRENLLAAIRAVRLPRGARVLDAGCGTGKNLDAVAREAAVRAFGLDVSPLASASWTAPVRGTCCVASVNDLPYGDAAFDLVYSVDVLGCRGVELERCLREIVRVLRPGGAAILLLPAYQWLRSRHDEAVHSVKRFTTGETGRIVAEAGLHVDQAGYRFSLLFPLIALVRLVRKMGMERRPPASDLAPLPAWINAALLAVCRWEQRLAQHVRMPFGSTVLVVARREAA